MTPFWTPDPNVCIYLGFSGTGQLTSRPVENGWCYVVLHLKGDDLMYTRNALHVVLCTDTVYTRMALSWITMDIRSTRSTGSHVLT